MKPSVVREVGHSYLEFACLTPLISLLFGHLFHLILKPTRYFLRVLYPTLIYRMLTSTVFAPFYFGPDYVIVGSRLGVTV